MRNKKGCCKHTSENISYYFVIKDCNCVVFSSLDLGHLQFSVEYIPSQLQLKIDLIGATDLPSKDSNGLSDPYVKLHLLPGIAKVLILTTTFSWFSILFTLNLI